MGVGTTLLCITAVITDELRSITRLLPNKSFQTKFIFCQLNTYQHIVVYCEYTVDFIRHIEATGKIFKRVIIFY